MIGLRAPGIGQGQDPHRQEKPPRGTLWSLKAEQACLLFSPSGAPNAAIASLTSVPPGADEGGTPSQCPLVSPPKTCPHQPENPSSTRQQNQASNVGSSRLPKHHQPMKSGTENLLVKPTRPPSSPCPCRGRTPLPLRCFLLEPCRHEGFIITLSYLMDRNLSSPRFELLFNITTPNILCHPLCPPMFW